MGLVILGLLALYILISILVVIGVIKHAKKNGKSALRWGGGGCGAGAVFDAVLGLAADGGDASILLFN